VELSPEAAEALLAYPFPGNVRELQNAIQRALIVSDGARIERQDLPARILAESACPPQEASARELSAPRQADPSRPLTLAELEQQAIQAALARTQNNLSQAARELGIDRSTLYRKLRQSEGAPP